MGHGSRGHCKGHALHHSEQPLTDNHDGDDNRNENDIFLQIEIHKITGK